jgi:2-dehydro-3-deoxyphosphooctonate aldolase (KDO 8-P synthase)
MAPWDMKNIPSKLESTGNRNLLLTERGVSFGYNNLVVDMRSLIIMRDLGYPVIFDATHSVQLPGGQGDRSGGQREMAPPLIRGAIAVGCDALFLEVHPDPDNAPSDGPNMIKIDDLPDVIKEIKALDKLRLEGFK